MSAAEVAVIKALLERMEGTQASMLARLEAIEKKQTHGEGWLGGAWWMAGFFGLGIGFVLSHFHLSTAPVGFVARPAAAAQVRPQP